MNPQTPVRSVLMGLSIHLLGRPHVTLADAPAPSPRGRKAWALLTYLAAHRTPVTRDQLAALLFAEADDPLRALRWNLAEIRRVVGGSSIVSSPAVALALPPGTYLDVDVLLSGSWLEAIDVPTLGGELLEGMDFSSSPAFDAWLLSRRRHLRAAAEGVLREAALARLAAGETEAAVGL